MWFFIFILKKVYCVYSLESPHWGDSIENTQHTVMLRKIKEIFIMPPDLVLLSTLNGSNYPCLELNFMVPKVFEPLKFDCIEVCQAWRPSFMTSRANAFLFAYEYSNWYNIQMYNKNFYKVRKYNRFCYEIRKYNLHDLMNKLWIKMKMSVFE